MPKLDSIQIRGRSGQEYEFRVYIWGHQFKQLPAVYVVTERSLKPDGPVLYLPVYAGQTADLSKIFENHPHEACFRLYLANTIAVLAESDSEGRAETLADVLGALRTPCNLVENSPSIRSIHVPEDSEIDRADMPRFDPNERETHVPASARGLWSWAVRALTMPPSIPRAG